MSRNFRIQNVRAGLGGDEHQPARYSANQRSADSHPLELGARFFSLAVIGFPSVIVGLTVLLYLTFVRV